MSKDSGEMKISVADLLHPFERKAKNKMLENFLGSMGGFTLGQGYEPGAYTPYTFPSFDVGTYGGGGGGTHGGGYTEEEGSNLPGDNIRPDRTIINPRPRRPAQDQFQAQAAMSPMEMALSGSNTNPAILSAMNRYLSTPSSPAANIPNLLSSGYAQAMVNPFMYNPMG